MSVCGGGRVGLAQHLRIKKEKEKKRMVTTMHKVGASTFLFGVSLFPPFLQTSYRHLRLVSRRHEVELFNVVTEVSAVTEQQRTRKQNGSVARSMLPMKSSPFNQMTCQLKLLPHVFQ